MERSERLEMRVTPEEKKTLLANAAALGLTLTSLVVTFLGTEMLGEKLADKLVQTVKTKNG